MADSAPTITHDLSERRSTMFQRLARQVVVDRLARIDTGHLTVRCDDGVEIEIGTPGSEPAARLEIHDPSFFTAMLTDGEIGAGEAYMERAWDSPDLVALTRLMVANEHVLTSSSPLTLVSSLVEATRHRLRRNSRSNARRNIRAHYDLSNELFATFLDSTMTYSSALFVTPADTLEQAQINKYRRLAELAGIQPGHRVLEIGCGWGGFATWAASELDCHVTGLTLSSEQAEHARQRVDRAGLGDRVEIRTQDYRTIQGPFDAVVSIEMLEAVGHEYLPQFFATLDRVLDPSGRAAVQVITFPDQGYDQYRRSSDWIRKYIFPGGHLPSLQAMVNATSRHTALGVRSVHDVSRHYAETLRRWRQTFLTRLDSVLRLGFDDRFIRMWELYLATCEGLFASGKLATLQLELARPGRSQLSKGPYTDGGSR
jgi:cyclopropane-fatty-acyl-phospholipid synthase